MKRSLLSRLPIAGLMAVVFAAVGFAQRDTISAAAGDKYVISARAGVINFLEGTVTASRKNGRGANLLVRDVLAVGDEVRTGEDGRAEVLLNPGSYVRLGPNSSFSFRNTALENLDMTVANGSAIFEVFADDEFRVAVSTPKGIVYLVDSGVYRIDVSADRANVEVWKGRAELSGSVIVKSGRQASIGAGTASVAKFDRGDRDALETWSKARAKELSKASAQLKRDAMRTALMQSFLGRNWNVFDSFGLWAWDPRMRRHCFVPFGYGWNSPYGYGYGHHLGWYNLPPVVYYPLPGTSPAANMNTKPGRAAVRSYEPPPFVRMENSGSAGVKTRIYDTKGDYSDPVRTSPPVYAPVISAPPILTSKPGRP